MDNLGMTICALCFAVIVLIWYRAVTMIPLTLMNNHR